MATAGPLALHLGADGSAGLKGFDQVPVLKGFEQVAIPALMMLLGVGKQEHDGQQHCHTCGDDILYHGCHSTR
jgi:hypothetical protein